MIYSGDDDAVCATLGSQQFVWDLGCFASYSITRLLEDPRAIGLTVAHGPTRRKSTFWKSGGKEAKTRLEAQSRRDASRHQGYAPMEGKSWVPWTAAVLNNWSN